MKLHLSMPKGQGALKPNKGPSRANMFKVVTRGPPLTSSSLRMVFFTSRNE